MLKLKQRSSQAGTRNTRVRCAHGHFALIGLVAIRVVAGWIVTGEVGEMASAGLGDQAWPIIHANFVKAAINRVLFFHGCADATIAAVLDVFDHLQPSAFMVPQCTAGADVGSQPFCSSPQYSCEMLTSRTDGRGGLILGRLCGLVSLLCKRPFPSSCAKEEKKDFYLVRWQSSLPLPPFRSHWHVYLRRGLPFHACFASRRY